MYLGLLLHFMIIIAHGYEGYTGWFHIPEPLQGQSATSLNLAGETVKTISGNLPLGVDFFFIISGFLITYLLLKEKQVSGKIHIGKFYIRRILRIWPVYVFIVIISKWWYVYLFEPRPDYWWTVCFLNNYQIIFTGKAQIPFLHFWSVCIEEHFYLFWPLIINFVPAKNLQKVFVVVILMSILFKVCIFLTSQNWPLQITYNTLSRMDTLAIGSWIGWKYFVRPFEIKIPIYVRIIVYLLFVLSFIFPLPFRGYGFFDAVFGKYIYHAFFIFWFVNYMFNSKAFFVFKTKNIIHYFGKISYGLYMYHNILIVFIVKMILWQLQLESGGFWVYWIIFIGLTIIVSVLSYELVEKHILKLKDRFAYIKTYR